MSVTVRFPPSPTGKMHLGNARTALFNWLYARHAQGRFLIRIEDTDAERSTPENIAYIYEALEWLGLSYDNQPFLQTTRLEQHTKAAQTLLEKGLAYKDPEGVTRFKIPAGSTTWKDLIQGEITIENKQVEDFALLRSNGTPTYHLGVVCDDIFQGVTHVIRGDDHINNTPKHILLFTALGAKLPQFGHLPLILGPDGEKLSKRHGAVSIQDLRDAGYLPQTVFNYMLRLGWSHGDQELFAPAEAAKLFDISHIHPSPARFDPAKLAWYNAHYLKTLPFAEILPHLRPFLEGAIPIAHCPLPITPLHPADLKKLEYLWADLAARAHTLAEIATAATPFLTDPTATLSAENTQILLEGHHALHHIYDALSALPQWEEKPLHDTLHHLVDHLGGGFKAVGRPLRVALTATTGGPDLSRIMAALGQQETLRRLKASLHHVHENGGHH